ncbi:hypothetical protein JY651_42405 [Pyxidicoccus parkwayensis]|uniref:Uncharacterized protein n=1 Tax=Pyxidicoccus parkwayensis TaxID=2813578 RepID=A0ABX7NSI6_9BACT|nr:hypothetical protein [Pyxidicoccus parkwaysis]QSQ21740.1 hypothetical protein JY651_42405 [Pyxidicoccus parkwaysis]
MWLFDAFEDIDLLGTEKDERDFSIAEQRKLFDTFFPVPVPPSASDVRIHYQGFQEWNLDISFTLPPGDYEAFVAQLAPKPDEPGAYLGRIQLGDGGFLANASTITVDPETRRVKLTAFTW